MVSYEALRRAHIRLWLTVLGRARKIEARTPRDQAHLAKAVAIARRGLEEAWRGR